MAASIELRIAKCQVPSGNTAAIHIHKCVCVCVCVRQWGVCRSLCCQRCGALVCYRARSLYRVPIAVVVIASVNVSCWQVINSFYCSHTHIYTYVFRDAYTRTCGMSAPEHLSLFSVFTYEVDDLVALSFFWQQSIFSLYYLWPTYF